MKERASGKKTFVTRTGTSRGGEKDTPWQPPRANFLGQMTELPSGSHEFCRSLAVVMEVATHSRLVDSPDQEQRSAMSLISVEDLQSSAADWVRRAVARKEVVIVKDGEPVARIVPFDAPAKKYTFANRPLVEGFSELPFVAHDSTL